MLGDPPNRTSSFPEVSFNCPPMAIVAVRCHDARPDASLPEDVGRSAVDSAEAVLANLF